MDTDSASGMEDQSAFCSENLEFCSYNPSEDNGVFNPVQNCASSIINWCVSTPRAMDRNFTSRVARHLQSRSLLFVIIFSRNDEDPIGTLFLESSHRDMVYHRCSRLEVGILKEHQEYETEAFNWALSWAFNSANLHRVEMNVPSWNLRMSELCDEIGFHTEGQKKERYFKDGEWWNEVNLAMLKKDWKERQA
ncbi:hypothetical protein ACN38_g313 [Penicillium nordicum]|uniref:N-acetyltransferase domain-containing protein n=1 Tax=Penicillium nordicum TaxID=229535 RepID=A0A0M9WKY0_9EURO|nr:hypothetical protein ACN38_g313 [Penicillium nordicum]